MTPVFAPDRLYLGEQTVDRAYLGDEQVWPPQAPEFSPADLTGLAGWWDASQLALADGAAVTSWTDLSGQDRHLPPYNGNPPLLRTNALNGLPVVRFDGVDDAFFLPTLFAFRQVFIVAKYPNTTFIGYEGLLSNGGGGSYDYMMVGGGPGTTWFYTSPHDHYLDGVLYPGNHEAPMARFGVLSASQVAAWSYLLLVGVDRGIGGRYWPGDVAEIVFYDRVLSEVERQQVEAYLAEKWLAPAPTTHFGTFARPATFGAVIAARRKTFSSTALPTMFASAVDGQVSTPAFSPANLSGLAVWLDASQLGLGDGAAVDPWPNPGSAADGAMAGTPAPVVRANALKGLPVVRFKPSEGRLRMTGTGAHMDWTVVYVGRIVGPTPGRVVNAYYPPNNLLVGFWNGQQDVMYDNGFASNTYAPWTTNWKLYSGDGTTSLSRLFSDGVLLGSTTTSAGWGGTFNVSGYAATEETCDCEVAEVVMYDRKLSDADRQAVEGYLREKWMP